MRLLISPNTFVTTVVALGRRAKVFHDSTTIRDIAFGSKNHHHQLQHPSTKPRSQPPKPLACQNWSHLGLLSPASSREYNEVISGIFKEVSCHHDDDDEDAAVAAEECIACSSVSIANFFFLSLERVAQENNGN